MEGAVAQHGHRVTDVETGGDVDIRAEAAVDQLPPARAVAQVRGQPVGDGPSPWGDFLKEHGESLHHVAFRFPDVGPELEKYRGLGMEAIASGKWPEGETRWGTYQYVQDPKGGVIVEFISRIPRK